MKVKGKKVITKVVIRYEVEVQGFFFFFFLLLFKSQEDNLLNASTLFFCTYILTLLLPLKTHFAFPLKTQLTIDMGATYLLEFSSTVADSN